MVRKLALTAVLTVVASPLFITAAHAAGVAWK